MDVAVEFLFWFFTTFLSAAHSSAATFSPIANSLLICRSINCARFTFSYIVILYVIFRTDRKTVQCSDRCLILVWKCICFDFVVYKHLSNSAGWSSTSKRMNGGLTELEIKVHC